MLLTVPEQLDGKRAALDHPGASITQQLAGLGWLTRHQWSAVLVDNIHESCHALSSLFGVHAPRGCSISLSRSAHLQFSPIKLLLERAKPEGRLHEPSVIKRQIFRNYQIRSGGECALLWG